MKASRKTWSERHKMFAELFLLVIAVPMGEALVKGLHHIAHVVLA